MKMESKWLGLLLLININISICEVTEAGPEINTKRANISQSEFMSKVHEVKRELYARYPKKLEDGSYPPPEGSKMSWTKSPVGGFRKHIVITQVYCLIVCISKYKWYNRD